MTGFDSKRQVSLDTLDHIGYQGRETRPEELAPKPVPVHQFRALGCSDWYDGHPDRTINGPYETRTLYTHPAAPVPAVQSAARAIADEQSYDTGLWFVATTASEAHLQAALRRLTAAVEGEAP
jgi:hypothetical protein